MPEKTDFSVPLSFVATQQNTQLNGGLCSHIHHPAAVNIHQYTICVLIYV